MGSAVPDVAECKASRHAAFTLRSEGEAPKLAGVKTKAPLVDGVSATAAGQALRTAALPVKNIVGTHHASPRGHHDLTHCAGRNSFGGASLELDFRLGHLLNGQFDFSGWDVERHGDSVRAWVRERVWCVGVRVCECVRVVQRGS